MLSKSNIIGSIGMAAFSPYCGAYEFGGRLYAWRCYATARVYDARLNDHEPNGAPPAGRRWVRAGRHAAETAFLWLVDAEVLDFSHILSLIESSGQADVPLRALQAGPRSFTETRP